MKYTHVFWDFNGTILDDLQAGYIGTNEILSRKGLCTIKSISEYKKYFSFPIIDYYKKLGFDFSRNSYDEIAEEWVKVYKAEAEHAELNHGFPEILDYLNSKGIKQIILSATEKNLLESQLIRLGIKDRFYALIAEENILGIGKKEIALNWIKNNSVQHGLLIGDTTHDYEVAKLIGVDAILFSGGHQSEAIISKCDCPIIDNIEEIKAFIE